MRKLPESNIKFSTLDAVEHVGAKLGKGAFAQVKLVQHKQSKKMLALKVIDLTNSQNLEQEREQIMIECRIHKELNHPNIIK
jgi:serine/threonine protein kinase